MSQRTISTPAAITGNLAQSMESTRGNQLTPSTSPAAQISFFDTRISRQAICNATHVLESGWVSEGRMVRDFEDALASSLGLSRPVAVNSGTAALHLALVLAGVEPGHEVILPAQTFVATGLVILMQGATPVFADIDPRTGNILPSSVAEKITERTRAIMPVHWGGYPCDLDEINALAAKHNLTVIEDAAHALGATYKGRPIGAISRFTAFSFQAIKHLTTGDGGALCSLAHAYEADARRLRWFGIDRTSSKPSILGEREYDIAEMGYKYHMNDIAAAIGLGNLEDFSRQFARRQHIGAYYREKLSGVPGLQLMQLAPDRDHAYWLFTILVERREDFIRKLYNQGISASVVHLGIDHNSIFGGTRQDLQGQAEYNARQVSIPVHGGLTDEDVERVVACVSDGW